MGTAEDDATAGDTAVETAIQQYLDSIKAGNSRKDYLSSWRKSACCQDSSRPNQAIRARVGEDAAAEGGVPVGVDTNPQQKTVTETSNSTASNQP